MSNPFKPSNSVVNKPKRHSFDLSHSNHLTFRFGQLIPCLCEEVLPGDTFKIDAALGLRFMPLAFPIQTKCRAHVHFFYQRAKNLWKDFPDFIYGNDALQNRVLVPPYLKFTSGQDYHGILRTGGIGDYLGLPTVRYGAVQDQYGQLLVYKNPGIGDVVAYQAGGNPEIFTPPTIATASALGLNTKFRPDSLVGTSYPNRERFGCVVFTVPSGQYTNLLDQTLRFSVDLPPGYVIDPSTASFGLYGEGDNLVPVVIGSAFTEPVSLSSPNGDGIWTRVNFETSLTEDIVRKLGASFAVAVIGRFTSAVPYGGSPVYPCATLNVYKGTMLDAASDVYGSPLADSDEYHISALPFRCYESIYNAFYRDNRNNPFKTKVDGSVIPVYNQYVTTQGSGADDTAYGIFNRNWELDQFTSSTSSPQQGVAPLVGITNRGDVTFALDGKQYTFTSETADDADTITKINVTENIPDAVARSIVNVVTSGISINDFRNVNAYQRWLETNLRRGLKYKDQTLARWGTQPADSTLDMPEFIGGFSVDVDINTVTNTSAGSDVPLGDYAAQATAFGGSKHRISQYCDQHGFIMAIVSVVPAPVYTQLLPKKFLRTSALDYYSPEFGQIGMQAVPYRELCPLELGRGTSTSIRPTDVFGYQRPWYEYIYRNDEAHGLFRTDFNQFLLSRTFGAPPTLGPDFLTIKESSLNDVFAVKNQNSILGMIRFNIEAQRPIPQVSVPSL